jgi:hypothetical protein
MSTAPREDKYWKYLRDPRVLRRAAHLVDKDSRADFEDSFIERQVFSFCRDDIISEISASLDAGRYMPTPITSVAIPKSAYSQRPGAILPYRDRILLEAVTMCLAPALDTFLSDSVWSWRVKKSLRGKSPDQLSRRSLFRESDLSEFPFLKKKTVSKYIQEIEPWYALWPRFERETRVALADDRYSHMVFSDIAGYFENIQLSLLHGLLNRYEPDAPNTINLLMRHLQAWCTPAYDGTQSGRGIPQGNSISSFLGNFFLKPVDDYFESHFDPQRVRYFRYMDDIRIITTNLSEARQAALALEAQIRRSQLNLQSAKTDVVTSKQAIQRITDRRLDELDQIRRLVRRKAARPEVLGRLKEVAADHGDSEFHQRIKGSRPPLTGLNLRVLRLWAGAHNQLGSTIAADRICREALANPNYKVIREVQRVGLTFPHLEAIPARIWTFLENGGSNFPYQEAELLRALRMFSYMPGTGYQYAQEKAINSGADSYLRLQAVLVLARAPWDWPRARSVFTACMECPDLRVITAGVLAASLDTPTNTVAHIHAAQRHASPDANRLIQYIRAIRQEQAPRQKLLSFIFGNKRSIEQLIYEYAPFLRFVASGSQPAASQLLDLVRVERARRGLPLNYRNFLGFLDNRCEATLGSFGPFVPVEAE